MEKTKFVQDLEKMLCKFDINKDFSEIVILCIGTDKLIGDCVGPMVGQRLINSWKLKNNDDVKSKEIIILGNMEKTLNYKNARDVIKQVNENYSMPFIIAIDTALSKISTTQKIYVNNGSLTIGNSLGRRFLFRSHINIKCVVGECKNTPNENIKVLKNVEPKQVMQLADIVAYGVNKTMQKLV